MPPTSKGKHIDNRVISGKKVGQSAKTHRNTIAKNLAERAIQVQGANTKATQEVFTIVLDFVADALEYSSKRIDDAEMRVTAERGDDVAPRERRDSLTTDLVTRMVRIRSNVLDALGAGALKTYGLDGATPRNAREAASHARNVANLMKAQPFNITIDGMTLNSAGMVTMIDEKALALETAIGDVDREAQELVDVIGQRDREVTLWVDDYQGGADSLMGLYRMGGRKDLAEWVKPTTRTLSGEDAVVDEGTVTAPTTDTGATDVPVAGSPPKDG